MPQIDVTKEELEAIIKCVVECRINGDIDLDTEGLPDLHLKLENALEQWVNGSTEELPVPAHFKALGVTKWEKVHPPHPG